MWKRHSYHIPLKVIVLHIQTLHSRREFRFPTEYCGETRCPAYSWFGKREF